MRFQNKLEDLLVLVEANEDEGFSLPKEQQFRNWLFNSNELQLGFKVQASISFSKIQQL